MRHKVNQDLQHNIELQAVSQLQIVCSKCNSDNCVKAKF